MQDSEPFPFVRSPSNNLLDTVDDKVMDPTSISLEMGSVPHFSKDQVSESYDLLSDNTRVGNTP